jgi:single-strand DNA-binding protein
MSRTLNKVMLIGRLGGAVELRYTGAGTPVASFSLATNHYIPGQNGQESREDTDWHRIVMWDKLAETANEYLQKGSQVYIEGRLQTRSWEDQQGQKRYTTEVVANQMIMLDSKPNAEAASDSREAAAPAPSNGNGRSARAVEEVELEAEELPF